MMSKWQPRCEASVADCPHGKVITPLLLAGRKADDFVVMKTNTEIVNRNSADRIKLRSELRWRNLASACWVDGRNGSVSDGIETFDSIWSSEVLEFLDGLYSIACGR